MQTPVCTKYFIEAYDNKIQDKYERRAVLAVFSDNEHGALNRAKTLLTRNFYEIFEVAEVADK